MTDLHIWSTSRAEEAGLLAIRDISEVADGAGVEYRIVGGQMVRLHVALAGVVEPVVRVTQDADMGVSAAAARNPGLLSGLLDLGYTRPGASNGFIREAEGLSLVIDVLAPAWGRRLVPNQQHGDIVLDEIPGLPLALASWSDRLAAKDAVDVWRLLRAHRQRFPDPIAWRTDGVHGDAVAVLRRDFGRPNGSGVRAASSNRADQAEIRALTLAVLRSSVLASAAVVRSAAGHASTR